MRSNIDIYEEAKKILGINQTEFATEFCKKSESYIRVLRKEPDRELPTEVLIDIWDKIDEIKSLKPQTVNNRLHQLQEKIAKEIIYRNTKQQNLKIREMLVRIITEINDKKHPSAPPIIIC